jgi:hypothetical protein
MLQEEFEDTKAVINFFLYHGCIVMVIKDSDCPFGSFRN